MPKNSCDLDHIPTPVLYDCLDEIIPIVTSIINKSLSSGIVPQCFIRALVKPLLKKRPDLIQTAWTCFQFAILVKGTGAYCSDTTFAAFTVSKPSRAVPVCPLKVSQQRNRLVAFSKWSTSGLKQWLCVCFVTAWPLGSLWHNWL